jgi:UTP--glucose-1-phosphate uridylyltransferase
VRGIVPSYASCIYIRQPAPLGLGHAVLCSRPAVGDEPFFVHLADDLIDAEEPCLKQMARVFEKRQASVLGVETVARDQTDRYGIVAARPIDGRLSQVERIVEKPKPHEAPSTLAVVGRYLLTPAVYDKLATTGRGAGGEIQLTDGIAALIADEPIFAFAFEGHRYDCGSKLGYLEATVEFALKHTNLGEQFAQYLAKLVAERLRR